MRATLFAIAAAAVLSLIAAGCIGATIPEECASYVQGDAQDQCTFEQAVLLQSPSHCYSISSMALRETCLSDSNNPEAARILADRLASGLPPMEEAPSEDGNATISAPEVPEQPPSDSIELCMQEQKLSRDACIRATAISNGDISLCQKISAGEYRESCIANIALSKKKLTDCAVLENPTDKQLCLSYSSG